jgi:hypothetical protein
MGIWKFESSQVSQLVPEAEKLTGTVTERPANGGLLRIGLSLQAPDFYPFRAKTPKVSGRTPEYSHFRETGTGDWVSIGTTWPSLHYSGPDVVRECGSGALMAGGAPVHFFQKLVHCIELRAEAFPISGLQSLHCLVVAIERLPCLICRRACEGYLLCRA